MWYERNRMMAAMILAEALLKAGITKPLTPDELIEILDAVFAALEIEVEWVA